ncbi:MAG: hypothetical protein GXZ08_09180, partial [Tissierellia bacterium]|nr:hypothetical protein [Tissierellia bacterium]
ENNEVSELLAVKLQANPDLINAGIKINRSVMTFPELLNYAARDGAQDSKYGVPTFHMFNMSTTFHASIQTFEYNYSTEDQFMGGNYNKNFIRDEELASIAKNMIGVEGTDKDGFKKYYVEFMSRWNELLPDIPLYSNENYDFYNERISNYDNYPFRRAWEVIMYAEIDK